MDTELEVIYRRLDHLITQGMAGWMEALESDGEPADIDRLYTAYPRYLSLLSAARWTLVNAEITVNAIVAPEAVDLPAAEFPPVFFGSGASGNIIVCCCCASAQGRPEACHCYNGRGVERDWNRTIGAEAAGIDERGEDAAADPEIQAETAVSETVTIEETRLKETDNAGAKPGERKGKRKGGIG